MSRALLIIDFQNDFTPPGGALAVPECDAIAPRISERIASGEFEVGVPTRARHQHDHQYFRDQGGLWPTHCVAGTPGAELHPSLHADQVDVIVDKGQDPQTVGY